MVYSIAFYCKKFYNFIMYEILCFVRVQFPDDPNVADMKYWYLCPFDGPSAGDRVLAPLGRHNHTQIGVICEVRITEDYNAPFPLYLIKSIKELYRSQ